MPAGKLFTAEDGYTFGGVWFHCEELRAVRAMALAAREDPVLSREEERDRARAQRWAREQLSPWPGLLERVLSVPPASREDLETFLEYALF